MTTNIASKALAGIMSAEAGVTPPRVARSSSFASVIADLRVGGDPASRAIQIDPSLSLEQAIAMIPELSAKLRNNVSPAVTRQTVRTGAEFTTEVGTLTTRQGMYVVAVITRVA